MGKVRMGASVSWCPVVFLCAVIVFGIDIQRGSAEVSEPSTVVEGNQETPEQEGSKGSTSETGGVTSSSEVLDTHLPVFKELKMPFVLQHNSRTRFSLDSEFEIRETSDTEITASIAAADRVLAF